MMNFKWNFHHINNNTVHSQLKEMMQNLHSRRSCNKTKTKSNAKLDDDQSFLYLFIHLFIYLFIRSFGLRMIWKHVDKNRNPQTNGVRERTMTQLKWKIWNNWHNFIFVFILYSIRIWRYFFIQLLSKWKNSPLLFI
jgi:hypothetical protein